MEHKLYCDNFFTWNSLLASATGINNCVQQTVFQISYRNEAINPLFCDALWNFEKLQKTIYSLISADLGFQRCQKGKILSYKGTNTHLFTRTSLLSQYPVQVSLKAIFQHLLYIWKVFGGVFSHFIPQHYNFLWFILSFRCWQLTIT